MNITEGNIMRGMYLTILVAGSAFLLSGCFPGGGAATPDEPAGIFSGIWHGWIAPVSLIAGVINPEIRVYETHNTGWFYDVGFYIAVISGFGGISLFRKRSKTKTEVVVVKDSR